MYHSNLGPDLSGCIFYSKPESGVHVTEMIVYDLKSFSTYLWLQYLPL